MSDSRQPGRRALRYDFAQPQFQPRSGDAPVVPVQPCAVPDCAGDGVVHLGTFGLCLEHEGRRLAGETFTIRRVHPAGGGPEATYLVFPDSPAT
jgi:hypothetical protein